MKRKKIEVKEQKKTEQETYQEQLQKMKKEEKFSLWKTIKEAWSNKRYRAMLILVFWFIFLFIIAGGLRNTPDSSHLQEIEPQEKKSALEVFRTTNNYEFKTVLSVTDMNQNQQQRVLEGRRLAYQEEFLNQTDQVSYFVDNGIIYKRSDEKLETTSDEFIEITLKPDVTYQMVKKATLESTTNYKDGSILNTYSLPLKEFISVYHNSNSNASGTITITVKEQENEVVEVSYDLLDFMNQQQVQYMEYQLTMTYQNVGKVDSIHLLQ